MTSPMLPATSPLPSPSPMYPPSNSPHPSQSPQPSMSPSPAGHHGYASQSPHPHLPSPRMHDDNPFSPNSMQRPPHTTSPAMSPASSHMSPVHCMSPGTGSQMSPVNMSPAGHMSPNHRQGSPQPNMVGMRPPIPAGQVMQMQGGRGFMRPVGPGFGNPMRPPTQQQIHQGQVGQMPRQMMPMQQGQMAQVPRQMMPQQAGQMMVQGQRQMMPQQVGQMMAQGPRQMMPQQMGQMMNQVPRQMMMMQRTSAPNNMQQVSAGQPLPPVLRTSEGISHPSKLW